MSSSVKKIFILLITVVALIAIGAFILNVFMPNVMASVFNAVDTAIYDATGIALDLNGDKVTGATKLTTNAPATMDSAHGTADKNKGVGVGGYSNKSKTVTAGK